MLHDCSRTFSAFFKNLKALLGSVNEVKQAAACQTISKTALKFASSCKFPSRAYMKQYPCLSCLSEELDDHSIVKEPSTWLNIPMHVLFHTFPDHEYRQFDNRSCTSFPIHNDSEVYINLYSIRTCTPFGLVLNRQTSEVLSGFGHLLWIVHIGQRWQSEQLSLDCKVVSNRHCQPSESYAEVHPENLKYKVSQTTT